MDPGYVYVVYVGRNLYKIGKSKNMDRQTKELKVNRVFTRVIRSNNHTELENIFHNKFASKRLTDSQELFYLDDEDILWIHQYEEADRSLSLF